MGRAFKEQIFWLTRAWDGWSEAEKVIALYSVARKLSPTSTRFLQTLLYQNTQSDNLDVLAAEARANDPAWIGRVSEAQDGGAADLLHHLPLLRPTNGEAKTHYLSVIPKVLAHVLSQSTTHAASLEKARQILSYSLIHPAFTAEEKKSLGGWLRALEDRLTLLRLSEYHASAYDTEDGDDTDRSIGRTTEGDKGGGGGDCKSNDGCGNLRTKSEQDRFRFPVSDGDQLSKYTWHESPTIITNEPLQTKDEIRWICLDPPQSPNNSGTSSRSSGSESLNEDCQAASPHPGMRDIGVWLKSLRLHKYSPLLCNLKYEELLSLDEEALEAKGVTKGARHKIVLSVAKLTERHKQLESIEKDLINGGSVQTALAQLKSIAITPMLPSHNINADAPDEVMSQPRQRQADPEDDVVMATEGKDVDLPSRFTRVIGKVCTQLLVCVRPDDEAMSSFLALVDKCLSHEAFTLVHTRLMSWKQQILRIWHPLPPRSKEGRHVRRWSQQYSGELLNSSFRSGRFTQQRYSTPSSSQMAGILAAAAVAGKSLQSHLTPPQSSFYTVPPSICNLMAPRTSLPGGATLTTSLLSPQNFLAKRPSLQEPPLELRPHVTLQRTRSAPSRPHQLPVIGQQSRPTPPAAVSPDRQLLNGPGVVPLGNKSGSISPAGSAAIASETTTDSDITNRLESLCLSMTEHALG